MPEEYKIQLRATIMAHRRGLSPQQAARAGAAEVLRWRELESRLNKTAVESKPAIADSASKAGKNARPERERAIARVRTL